MKIKVHCGVSVPAGPVIAYVARPSRSSDMGLRLACPHCWEQVNSRRRPDYVLGHTAHAIPCGTWVYVDQSKPSTNGHGAMWLEPTTEPAA